MPHRIPLFQTDLQVVYKGKTDFLDVTIVNRMLSHDNPNNIPKMKFSDVATAKSRENNMVLKIKNTAL